MTTLVEQYCPKVPKEIFADDYITISKLDNAQYFSFHFPKNLSTEKTMAMYLHYFSHEFEYMSKDAMIDLISMAFDMCKPKLTLADRKFLHRLQEFSRKSLTMVLWNIMLKGEGLSNI